MLVNIDKNRKVCWYNPYISQTLAEQCLSANTFWLDTALPEQPTLSEDEVAVLYLSEDQTLYYQTEPAPAPVYTETELIMQEFVNLELMLLEGGVLHV